MDLLGEKPVFSLQNKEWRVYTRHSALSPQYIGEGAKVKNSIISEGCEIYGTVENSVLFAGVRVMPGAVVRDSVVMSDTVIGRGAEVSYSIIDSNVDIGAGATIGGKAGCADGISVIGADEKLEDGAKICAGDMIPDVR